MKTPTPLTPSHGIVIPDRRPSRIRALLVAGAVAFIVGGLAVAAAYAGVFTKDESPPVVKLVTPAEGAKYAGVLRVKGSVGGGSRLKEFSLRLDGADRTPRVALGKIRGFNFDFKLDTAKLDDGKHELALAAADEGGRRADVKVAFYVENHATVLKLAFDPVKVDQGRVMTVKLTANKRLYDLKGNLWDQKFPFFKVADGFQSLVGIRASCPPGDYPVKVTGYDAYDKPVNLEGVVSVANGGYIKEEIEIASREKKALFDPALAEKKQLEYQREESILTRNRDEQLWAGTFVIPTAGRQTSPFGSYRVFSTGGEERHLGVDIAAKEGTPVRAANRGIVMMAEKLIVRGNAVLVDHGRGVFSIYNHMSALAVKPGDRVEKGQVLGYVGSTGLSTGPHLHWEMRVFKWVVDPLQWTAATFTYRPAAEEEKAVADVEAAYKQVLEAPLPPKIEPAGTAKPEEDDE
jgi:hypothetical protein